MTLIVVSLDTVRKSTLLLFLLGMLCLSAAAQTPTVHASSVSFSDVYCNEVTISWTSGDGDNRLMFMREGAAVDTLPQDFQVYAVDSEFGAPGSKVKNSYAVYNGTGNSVTISGLKKSTTYHIAIFEYNNNSGTEYYTSNGYATASQKTENITANFSIDTKYQCLDGNSFTFTNASSNSIGVSMAAMTYEWDFGDKSTIVTTQNASYSYSTGGIFDVTLTAKTIGCETDTAIRDTVVVPWIIDFELDTSIQGNDTIQCFGDNSFDILNLSAPPDKPIYGLYDRTRSFWSTDRGHSGAAFNFDFNSSDPGEIRVKLIMGRLVSPGRSYCFDSTEKVFTILPPALDSSMVLPSDTAMCLTDNNFTFTHTASAVQDTKWYFGDGDSSDQNPANHTYGSAGAYEYVCQVVDTNGCVGEVSDTVLVVQIPNNYFTGLNDEYCQGDPIVKLQPNLPGGEFRGSGISTTDSTFSPNSPGTFIIEYEYAIGSCRDTFYDTTEVLARPNFNLGPDTIICGGTTITLSIDSPGYAYSWDDGSTGQTRVVNSAGNYWGRATNGNCSFSDSIDITGVQLPDPDLGNDTSICGGEFVSVSIQADAGTIVWNDGSPAGFSREITESGAYIATVNHPCGVVSDTINVDILPTACEIFIPNAFSPNDDFLNEVFYPQGLFVFTSMQVWNEYGEQLFESFDEGKGWDGKVNGEVCPPGTYYYLIRYQLPEGGTYVKKSASGPVFLIW